MANFETDFDHERKRATPSAVWKVRWCFIVVATHASTDAHGNTTVRDDLTVKDALKRWPK